MRRNIGKKCLGISIFFIIFYFVLVAIFDVRNKKIKIDPQKKLQK